MFPCHSQSQLLQNKPLKVRAVLYDNTDQLTIRIQDVDMAIPTFRNSNSQGRVCGGLRHPPLQGLGTQCFQCMHKDPDLTLRTCNKPGREKKTLVSVSLSDYSNNGPQRKGNFPRLSCWRREEYQPDGELESRRFHSILTPCHLTTQTGMDLGGWGLSPSSQPWVGLGTQANLWTFIQILITLQDSEEADSGARLDLFVPLHIIATMNTSFSAFHF